MLQELTLCVWVIIIKTFIALLVHDLLTTASIKKTLLPYNNSETKASGLLENREEISSWYDMISDDYIQ